MPRNRSEKTPPPEVDEWGNKRWFLDGELHREDGPAIEHASGTKWWCRNGVFHREGAPAIEAVDGRREWWLHGERQPDAT